MKMATDENDYEYQEEIRRMMHAFGDDFTPATLSSKFVENEIHSMMFCLLKNCSENALKRSSNVTQIRDIFDVMKRSPFRKRKIAKMIHYFRFMDLKETVTHSNNSGLNGSTKKASKMKQCYVALMTDEESKQEYENIFDENYIDDITMERRAVFEKRGDQMTLEEHRNFADCRIANFRGGAAKRFQNWIQPNCDNSQNLSQIVVEALQHIAIESVALLVEKASNLKNETQQRRMFTLKQTTNHDSRLTNIFDSLQSSQITTPKFIEKRHYSRILTNLSPEERKLFFLYL